MSRRHWTDEQIEHFHDGEMDAADAGALGADLDADHALRTRLDAVERADALVARVLSRPAQTPSRSRVPWAVRLGAPGALAAMIALLAMLPMLTRTPRPAPVETAMPAQSPGDVTMRRPLAILRLPAGASLASLTATESAGDDPPPEVVARPEPSAERMIAAAIEAGDTIAAISAIDRLTPRQRDRAYRDLGRTVRSGRAAEEFLDSIEPERQVAICRVWASDGNFRPVTLERLRVLSQTPGLEASTRDAVESLAAQPELGGWLKSYGLARAR